MRFILSVRYNFHSTDSQSIAVHVFASRVFLNPIHVLTHIIQARVCSYFGGFQLIYFFAYLSMMHVKIH